MIIHDIINKSKQQHYQLIISFIYGAIVGPFASSLVILVLSLILIEVVYAICNITYNVTQRCEVLYAYLSGWIIARTLVCEKIFPEWVP